MKRFWSYVAVSGAIVVVVLLGSVPAPARVAPLAAEAVTEEYPTSQLISSPAPWGQIRPVVARGAGVSLAVWGDARGGVFGARIAGDGAVLDPFGVRISTGGSPAVAWNGEVFLVVWEFGDGQEIRAARVDETGSVLDAVPITVSAASGRRLEPAVAAGGSGFLVTWQDARADVNSDVYAARVTGSGAVLDPSGIRVVSGPGAQVSPSIASDGTSFLIVWHHYVGSSPADVLAARVNSAGVVLDATPIAISSRSSNEWFGDVVWGPGGYLVVWSDDRAGVSDIYGARVNAAGAVADPDGFVVSSAPNAENYPSVASDGARYLVVWGDRRAHRAGPDTDDVWAARVDGSGIVLDPNGFLVARAAKRQTFPDVAARAGGFLVLWEDSRVDYGLEDIYATSVTQSGTTQNTRGTLVSMSANAQLGPAVASNGEISLVVWEDLRSGRSAIYAARMAQDGTLLDPRGVLLTSRRRDGFPRVAWNGSVFLVVWSGENVYGARVSPEGERLDPGGGFLISAAKGSQSQAAVATLGSDFFVTWRDARLGKRNNEIYGSRVDASGHVLDNDGIRISTLPGHDGVPTVAGTGDAFIIAWQNHGQNKTYAARVGADGTLLDNDPILLASGFAGDPSVASNGSISLVVWETCCYGAAADLAGVRINNAGTVLDQTPIVLTSAPNQQVYARATWLGNAFFVAWRDLRSGTRADLFGTRVSQDGDVLDPAGIEIATSVSTRTENCLGLSADAIVYQRVVPEQPYLGVERVFLRRISPP